MPKWDDAANEVFLQALEVESAEMRRLYLDDACGADTELRKEVESLLLAHDEAGSFLGPLSPEEEPTIDLRTITHLGARIGRYKLLDEIGEGGFGIVYLAEQREPVRRKVALKIIKPGMDTRQVIARFEAERQALAMMDHPNIAHVFDGGATEEGRPYFVMELVHGMPITKYCDEARLTTDERLELFISVCDAVQHAHQKGIIHRDIKPSNVLVTLQGDTPVVKVIDFGVAKAMDRQLTEKTVFTGSGEMIGTPLYMSPEQMALSGLDVDTRSDIYSLGILLYELLTGMLPFDKQRMHDLSLEEFRRVIREEEPPRPSMRVTTVGEIASTLAERRKLEPVKLQQTLRGELDWIVMKALEKDRIRRYESASDFAKDIQRHLDDEPVEACPPSTAYQLRKFYRRHKTVFTFAISIALTLIIGAGLAVGQAIRATKAERREREQGEFAEQERKIAVEQKQIALKQERLAKKQQRLAELAAEHERAAAERERLARKEADRNLYLAHMRVAQQDWEIGQTARLQQLLDPHVPKPGEPDDYRGWEWYYYLGQSNTALRTRRGHTGGLTSISWSPDGQRLATASEDGTVRIWNRDDLQPSLVLVGHKAGVNSVAWAPDGARLASGAREIIIWDAATGQRLRSFTSQPASVWCVAWNRDGNRLASSTNDNTIVLWDAESGKLLKTFTVPERFGTSCIGGIAWSPDGNHLAGVGIDHHLRIWDPATAELVADYTEPKIAPPGEVAYSPDGQRLAVGGRNPKLLDAKTLKLVYRLSGHTGDVRSLCWSPNGTRLATGSADQTIRVWDAERGELERVFRGHTHTIRGLAWSPEGRLLASASSDGTVKLWDTESRPPEVEAGQVNARSFAWSPDGKMLASADIGGTLTLWDPSTLTEIRTLHRDVGFHSLEWSPDSRWLAFACPDGIGVCSAKTFEMVMPCKKHPSTAYAVAWAPDSRRLLSTSGDEQNQVIKIWEVASGRELLSLNGQQNWSYSAAWRPDGRLFATGGTNSPAVVREAATGRTIVKLTGQHGHAYCIAFSPDGQRLATSNADGSIKLWDTDNWEELATLIGHSGEIFYIAWSPDNQRLGSVGQDGTARLWDVATGQEVIALREDLDQPGKGKAAIISIAWNPTNRWQFATWSRGMIRIWDAGPGRDYATSPQYHYDRARRLVFLRRNKEALKLLRSLVSENPAEPQYQNELGACLTRTGHLGEAFTILENLPDDFTDVPDQAATLNSEYALLGNSLRDAGQLKDAEKAYRNAIAISEKLTTGFPSNQYYWFQYIDSYDRLASLLKSNGRTEEAEETLQRMEDPPTGDGFSRRADLFERMGDSNRALADYERSLQFPSAPPTTWYHSALAQLGGPRADTYKATCRAMVEQFKDGTSPADGYWIAWTCLLGPDAIDDYAPVVQLAEQAVASDPKSDGYLKTLGGVLYRAGRFEEAAKRLTDASNLVEDPDGHSQSSPAYTWYLLVMAHHRLGHDQEAKDWLGKANEWTDKVLADDEAGTTELPWNRHLTLKLFREEAEGMIEAGKVDPAQREDQPTSEGAESTETEPAAEAAEQGEAP